MMIECQCGNKYETTQDPCPDGRQGCLVNHTNYESYRCESCGTNNVPRLSDGVTMSVGMAVGNLRSIMKLDLYKG